MLYSAFAILGLPILSGCVATAAAAPPPDVLDNLRYCTIHRQTEVEARERAQRPSDIRSVILNAAISRLTATLNQNGASPLECTFRIPYPDITDVILGALDSQHALDWCTKYLANLTNTTVEFPQQGAIISNFVAGCKPEVPFIEGMLLPSITLGVDNTLKARGNFEIRGPSINKTTHIFFANGTRTNIAAVQNGTVSIPNISGEVGVIGLSSSIFEDATITSLMSVVHIEKIEDNPNIKDNPTIEAIQLSRTIQLSTHHGMPSKLQLSTITIFILFLLGIWPATLTKYREDAWHFFGSFAIYIINGFGLSQLFSATALEDGSSSIAGGNAEVVMSSTRSKSNSNTKDAPTPAPAAIPAAVLVPHTT
ncbi:hypothetical protein BDD12DRAFT_811124 [Trichophaea hybrida]|nr:hypothetical protein BDD12DRAFT_811124 [Trichophaea hybrida]